MIKLLILSYPVWDERNNSVNTYINLFGDANEYEVANIATLPGSPYGTVCKRFFLITEKMILKHLVKGDEAGKEIYFSEECDGKNGSNESRVVRWIKTSRLQLVFWLRELIWLTGCWKSKALDDFIKNYNPDVVVVPVKASRFFNRLGQYVHKVSGKPMVCFVSDDVYTYKTFSWSPLYWIDRMVRRPAIRKSIKSCDVLYTLTDKQKKEYDAIFGVNSQVITKSGFFPKTEMLVPDVKETVRLIYTGNIGAGRWHTLAMIGDALKGKNAELLIYSGTHLKESQRERLEKSGKVKMMGLIAQDKVKEVQKGGDILVHVESFDLSERYSARLSFSTKIVDYFEAARCILAVGWEKTAAIEYLKEKDAAYIITDVSQIHDRLTKLLDNKIIIKEYAAKGYSCGQKYHNKDAINNRVLTDMKALTVHC